LPYSVTSLPAYERVTRSRAPMRLDTSKNL
jgi:hypothetical protein